MDKNKQETRYGQWRQLIEEHKKSGLSQINFCKQKGISSTHLSYYRARIKRIKAQNKKDELHLFAPIQLQKSSSVNEIQVLLPNGLKCILPTLMDVTHIKRWMEVLLTC